MLYDLGFENVESTESIDFAQDCIDPGFRERFLYVL
jgi:hypothetical protein